MLIPATPRGTTDAAATGVSTFHPRPVVSSILYQDNAPFLSGVGQPDEAPWTQTLRTTFTFLIAAFPLPKL